MKLVVSELARTSVSQLVTKLLEQKKYLQSTSRFTATPNNHKIIITEFLYNMFVRLIDSALCVTV